MAIIDINRTPGQKELNVFGYAWLVMTTILGLVAWLHFGSLSGALWLWSIGGGVAGLYFAIPTMRLPLFMGMTYMAFPIGWVLSHLLLGIVYYLVMTPIGLIMRLCGRDPMGRKFVPEATTYWVKRPEQTKPERYFRQF